MTGRHRKPVVWQRLARWLRQVRRGRHEHQCQVRFDA